MIPFVPRFQAKPNSFCGDLRTRCFDSDAANGERRRTVELYNGPIFQEPDNIFLQVGGNDFPRTARSQRDADAFSFQLLELTSLLDDRYKAKRVVVGCILPRSSARRFRRGFSPLEVMQLGASSQHRAYRAQPESATNSVSSSTSEWPSTSIDSLAGCWGP